MALRNDDDDKLRYVVGGIGGASLVGCALGAVLFAFDSVPADAVASAVAAAVFLGALAVCCVFVACGGDSLVGVGVVGGLCALVALVVSAGFAVSRTVGDGSARLFLAWSATSLSFGGLVLVVVIVLTGVYKKGARRYFIQFAMSRWLCVALVAFAASTAAFKKGARHYFIQFAMRTR